ncbi:LysR substrate-binding domain-containing protein [Pseudomonas matsuisoli]|uniref:Transcriptional regulator n=1 Tax=Pseudomonas matsuisoli TaxID=1515666 RepID=A0A917UZ33_9PSED|nr:LysR substrate-binding domain-containing protein [Pseudomonas matsuisoli]GGJ99199.1 transcriptional regulator [Pseudomonas matsuisoli]
MELRHLRYFIAVAEELHFGRAAERLNISQPPLSQQIQLLEADLGVRLLERTKRRVALTQAGQLYLEQARLALQQVDKAAEVARRAQRGEVGALRMGFTPSAPFTTVIPRSLLAFRRAYPMVHLDLEEMNSRSVVEALLADKAEVGVIRPIDLPAQITALPLFHEPLVAVLNADHPLGHEGDAPLSLSALANEAFVFFPRGFGTGLFDQLMTLAGQAGFTPKISQEVGDSLTIIGLVAAGLGVSVLPASYRCIAIENVVYRPLTDPGAVTSVLLVRRAADASPVVSAFVDIVSEEAKRQRA